MGFMNYFKKSIQRKLRLSYLALVLIATLSGVFSYYQFNKVSTYQSAKNDINGLRYNLAEARESEKRFILTGRKKEEFLTSKKCQELTQQEQYVSKALQTCESLKTSNATASLGLGESILLLEKNIDLYQKIFSQLVTKYHIRGFKDFGLEGEMRNYVHDLQKGISEEEKVFAYSLRRHEKDFIIRQDLSYLTKLEETALEFIQFVENAELSHMDEIYRSQTVSFIKAYVEQFKKITSVEKEIGLTDNEGILGDLNDQTDLINQASSEIYNSIEKATQNVQKYAAILLIVSIVSILTIGLLFSIILASTISQPIRKLHAVVQEILEGRFEAIHQLKSFKLKDEIGGLILSFTEMVASLENKLGEINSKNERLEEKRKEEDERNWLNTQISNLGDTIRDKYESTEELLQKFLSQLVKATGVNQGIVFVKEKDQSGEEFMTLKAAYAFGRKKFLNKQISKGEGLAGQAWIEGDQIYLSEVPANYIHIGSGLGDARPRCVFLMPIKDQEEVVGIIELAAFESLAGMKKQLIEQIAGRLGGILASQKMAEENRKLLEESSLLLNELRSSEEEMKQNMEEMQATQEEASRLQNELQKENHRLHNFIEIEEKIISKAFDSWVLVDQNTVLQECNVRFSQLLGNSDEKPFNKPIAECFDFPLETWISDQIEQPYFKLCGYSKPYHTDFIGTKGVIHKISLVLTEIDWKGENLYLLLLHQSTKKSFKNASIGGVDVMRKLLYN
jgi:HAMP domain-containing protein